MADKANRYPNNAEGKFYVDEACIDCDLCREHAPRNFERSDETGYSRVKKQPEGDDEAADCAKALAECPVQAIGDDGDTA